MFSLYFCLSVCFCLLIDISPTAAVNECVVTKPCKNGATCVDLKDGYRCLCIPGFTGKDCEQGNAIKEQTIKNVFACFKSAADEEMNKKVP